MSDAATSPGRESHRVVAMLVGHALDDLESERIDIDTAFRLVAERAWAEGYGVGLCAGGCPEPSARPPPRERCRPCSLEGSSAAGSKSGSSIQLSPVVGRCQQAKISGTLARRDAQTQADQRRPWPSLPSSSTDRARHLAELPGLEFGAAELVVVQ
jgi:hypothetical protein